MRPAVAWLALLCAACNGGQDGPGQKGRPSTPSQAAIEASLAVTEPEPVEGVDPATPGRIVGTARFEGEPPLRAPLRMVKETAGCLEHGQEPPLAEAWVVDADGHVANVVVRLLRAPDAPAAPETPVEVDQHGCMFVPHVVAVQAGRPVRVTNTDPLSHNVRLKSARNRERNETVGPGGDPIVLEMIEPDKCTLACDIHPWMGAHLIVVEHPWFAVSAADGTFTIEGIPPGTYGLEAWHEQGARPRVQRFVLAPGATVSAEVVFRR